MEIPNVKKDAHQRIDSLEGNILGIVQIMADDKGHLAVCVGGIPDVIVDVLAKVMKSNHQIREFFESAWCAANDTNLNLNLQ